MFGQGKPPPKWKGYSPEDDMSADAPPPRGTPPARAAPATAPATPPATPPAMPPSTAPDAAPDTAPVSNPIVCRIKIGEQAGLPNEIHVDVGRQALTPAPIPVLLLADFTLNVLAGLLGVMPKTAAAAAGGTAEMHLAVQIAQLQLCIPQPMLCEQPMLWEETKPSAAGPPGTAPAGTAPGAAPGATHAIGAIGDALLEGAMELGRVPPFWCLSDEAARLVRPRMLVLQLSSSVEVQKSKDQGQRLAPVTAPSFDGGGGGGGGGGGRSSVPGVGASCGETWSLIQHVMVHASVEYTCMCVGHYTEPAKRFGVPDTTPVGSGGWRPTWRSGGHTPPTHGDRASALLAQVREQPIESPSLG